MCVTEGGGKCNKDAGVAHFQGLFRGKGTMLRCMLHVGSFTEYCIFCVCMLLLKHCMESRIIIITYLFSKINVRLL